ncbi:hypothetical protein C475_01307 [Halosimplex carlsbadense 2-9-1]|uniref:DUF192 domain-containing protein n=2 Tax=Halosimplex carlsbadense TaxID=171164 RepID=M0D4E8_9EURY|nr:hypothetical protein C475_01307 [Halosimplex carlsbadense 2-9-1]
MRATLVLSVGLMVLVVLRAIRTRSSSGDISGYERTAVFFSDGDGAELGTARVRIADTDAKRYVGLSRTESLREGEGMLFVHPCEQSVSYVMREMSFPLDIVFVDEDRTVTDVYHAELPADGLADSELERYDGRAKYVLELPYQYTSERGIGVGDRIRSASDRDI